jgi:hypothetical protein
MCGEERLDLYCAVTRTPSEYVAVRIDSDSDSDSDPERQRCRTLRVLERPSRHGRVASKSKGLPASAFPKRVLN